MKIGITNDFFINTETMHTDYSKVKSYGFDCVDYQNLASPEGYLCSLPQSEMEDFLAEERRIAEDSGVFINQVHGPWPVDDKTEEMRTENFEYMKKTVAGACILGAKYLVVHPVMPYGWGREDSTETAQEINFDIFSRLCDFARPLGVTVCIENLPFKAVTLSHFPALREFVDKVNRDNFMICLDTGHANMYTEDSIEKLVNICGSKLACLHIHDNNTRDDAHLIPFMGRVKWYEFMKALKNTGYTNPLSLEVGIGPMPPEHITGMFLKLAYETAKELTDYYENL